MKIKTFVREFGEIMKETHRLGNQMPNFHRNIFQLPWKKSDKNVNLIAFVFPVYQGLFKELEICSPSYSSLNQ